MKLAAKWISSIAANFMINGVGRGGVGLNGDGPGLLAGGVPVSTFRPLVPSPGPAFSRQDLRNFGETVASIRHHTATSPKLRAWSRSRPILDRVVSGKGS
ncbi:hypothetical protein GA0070611_5565 [Micromonospora auratinigra]|uniref:Uncharacterized protein n=1 Tax=Micromonospora auratinigra TaxID=261654 RepID=A0A1A9A846_9ACTN|nr:hypothetical protein GA0070611_5565 [Micromonospora auratinigra]